MDHYRYRCLAEPIRQTILSSFLFRYSGEVFDTGRERNNGVSLSISTGTLTSYGN